MKDAALLCAFIEVESSFRPTAFLQDANGGSYGLMQIDLPTAIDRGFEGHAGELYVPSTNLKYGTAQLDWIARELQEHGLYSVANLAAAYNAGLSHVLSGGTDPAYSEKIETAYAKYQAILV